MKDLLLAIVLIAFLAFISNPMGIYMSNMMLGTAIVFTVVLFIVFAITVFKNKPRDEREMLNEQLASKIAYIIGVFGLLVILIVKKLSEGHTDFLVASLLVLMILSETAIRWSKNNAT
jgi:uncharacterized membrane protein